VIQSLEGAMARNSVDNANTGRPLSAFRFVAAQLRAHPRLFFTASELHALRAKAKDDSKGEMGFSQ